MLSYWEKQNFLHYDFIVIGSGIVGLSTALSIRERKPKSSILVLERGILPTGASTKNAGFACIGSLTEILDDLKIMSESEVLRLVALRLRGLERLRKRLGDENIGYAENGSYELISEHELSALDQFYHVNDMLRPLLHRDAFSRADHKINDFGFNTGIVKHVIQNNAEGELDTGKMMKALMQLCVESGIEIKTGAEVINFVEEADGVKVFIDHKHLAQHITFSCHQLAICTNAFTNQLVHGLDVHPGRGQVLITQPIPDLKIKGIFHFDKGYYYFREVDGRILFGGGRNLDFNGERTETLSYNELILADLLEKLSTMILPDTHYEIDYAWTGIMAFGSDKFPLIVPHGKNIFLGVRMGGMGVAMGSEVGERLATLMTAE
jgi:glycine/D-amino acid oxidase-like deaminating enzyme